MNHYKILIADDERDFVDTLRDRLRASGLETIEAYEGVRAIELAHKEKPDLILLDLRMPGGTGQTVIKALRSRPETKGIPIIVVSALSAKDVQGEVLEAGAQCFFQKPYDITKLLDKIMALLSSSGK